MTDAAPSSSQPAPASSPLPRLERTAALLLRLGVGLSLGLAALGLLVGFAHQPRLLNDPQALAALLDQTTAFPDPGHSPGTFQRSPGTTLIVLGLLILILTPVFRVAASLVIFALQRDRLYSLITAAVLLLLILSFFLGYIQSQRPPFAIHP